jgi:hypothetical protein
MDPEDDLKYGDSPQNPVGMRAQVGGGLAIFIGVVLFVFYPHVAADAPINLHQMAGLFIGIGILLLAIGTLARMFFLD